MLERYKGRRRATVGSVEAIRAGVEEVALSISSTRPCALRSGTSTPPAAARTSSRRGHLVGRQTQDYVFAPPAESFNICINSMGNGKMIVEFCSAEISVSVDR